jgi:hypothetical protein
MWLCHILALEPAVHQILLVKKPVLKMEADGGEVGTQHIHQFTDWHSRAIACRNEFAIYQYQIQQMLEAIVLSRARRRHTKLRLVVNYRQDHMSSKENNYVLSKDEGRHALSIDLDNIILQFIVCILH